MLQPPSDVHWMRLPPVPYTVAAGGTGNGRRWPGRGCGGFGTVFLQWKNSIVCSALCRWHVAVRCAPSSTTFTSTNQQKIGSDVVPQGIGCCGLRRRDAKPPAAPAHIVSKRRAASRPVSDPSRFIFVVTRELQTFTFSFLLAQPRPGWTIFTMSAHLRWRFWTERRRKRLLSLSDHLPDTKTYMLLFLPCAFLASSICHP
jgi:hypothetical protein